MFVVYLFYQRVFDRCLSGAYRAPIRRAHLSGAYQAPIRRLSGAYQRRRPIRCRRRLSGAYQAPQAPIRRAYHGQAETDGEPGGRTDRPTDGQIRTDEHTDKTENTKKIKKK